MGVRMGEAKRKAEELWKWLDALTEEERVVYGSARALFGRVFGRGQVYSYHLEMSETGRAALEKLRISGD